eukprot:scaffold12420_cov137-Skeletonema_marinoi.AAC.3
MTGYSGRCIQKWKWGMMWRVVYFMDTILSLCLWQNQKNEQSADRPSLSFPGKGTSPPQATNRN